MERNDARRLLLANSHFRMHNGKVVVRDAALLRAIKSLSADEARATRPLNHLGRTAA